MDREWKRGGGMEIKREREEGRVRERIESPIYYCHERDYPTCNTPLTFPFPPPPPPPLHSFHLSIYKVVTTSGRERERERERERQTDRETSKRR